MKKIKRNMVKCLKCGDIVISKKPYGVSECSCGTVIIGGGYRYLKRKTDPALYEELSEFYDDTSQDKKEKKTQNL